jgi:putative CocE/NonD family hydrolase
MVAPVTHCAYTRASEHTMVGDRDVGDARWDYSELIYAWFDYWLKGEQNGITDTLPRVRYYTMGSNQWHTTSAWPPPEAEMVTYWLHSDGTADTSLESGRLTRERPGDEEPVDVIRYDPMDPVVSHGGNVCCIGGAIDAGSLDQREVERDRNDILVYTTESFPDGVDVTGPVEVTLFVSSDARDTDFTVKLLDVFPDGRAYNLDESIQRARYREGYGREVFMEPGVVYEVKVGPLTTSNYFAPGHRIRIEVSSSNFPRFTRNLNTGGRNFDETEGVVALNQLHHTRDYPSQLRLSVVRR